MSDFIIPKKNTGQSRPNRPVSHNKRPPRRREARELSDRVTLANTPGKSRTPAPPEIRRDVVKKFRRILESGNYEVKAEEIADKIVQKIREEKDRIIS